jgi:IMP dehydrogenase
MSNSKYTFNDVLFKPQYSEVTSRSLVNVSTDMGIFKLNIPIVSANMKDITGSKMAIAMAESGALGILHRFGSIETLVGNYTCAINSLKDKNIPTTPYSVGVSIGVKEEDKELFKALYDVGARNFTIDIAHGHCLMLKNMVKFIRNNSNEDLSLIGGNIATAEAAKDLLDWGVGILKVGIGPGGVCQTRTNTGVGVPQLSAIEEIRTAFPNSIIISDGGIKTSGCICKAMKYANAVMVGSYISGTTETPGKVYKNMDGKYYKTYGGSASGENKIGNGAENSFVEGVVKTVDFRGHVKYILQEIKEALQSSFSYSGSFCLKEFQEKSVLIQISGGGKQESKI